MLSIFQQSLSNVLYAGHHFCQSCIRPHSNEIIVIVNAWARLIIIVPQWYYNVCIAIKKELKQVFIKRFLKKNLANVGKA